ncbi:MAG TPA: VWA domain-containing protein [Candidatus Acidoferrales bacterium]|nr:VWA domain-containing protein [Candidatus Acidoferrales bacterium]
MLAALFEFGAIAVLGGLFFTTSSHAQTWTRRGPGPITHGQVSTLDGEVEGAINALAPHPTDANILYVGAVNGGIWKTTNATSASPNWTPQTDMARSASIGALEFDPTDATNSTLVAGFGAYSSFGDNGPLTGLLRTTDGGANWIPIDGGGVLDGFSISGVVPRGSTIVISVVYVLTSYQKWGIWRSTDLGVTWTQISGSAGTGLPAGGSYDLISNPTNSAQLYTNAGVNGLYRSTDNGATWTKVSSGALDDSIRTACNIEMAMGVNNNIYAAIVSGNTDQLSAVFRSGDGGTTWTLMDLPSSSGMGTHPGHQGFLHLSIAADPNNANIVYVGGDYGPRFRGDASNAAGSQFVPYTDSQNGQSGTLHNTAPHADSRDLRFAANGDLLEVDDGGIYRRTNPQTSNGDWSSMNGDIQVTEFHSTAWDANSKIIIGGTQDNDTPEQTSPASTLWSNVDYGDGGVVAVDDRTTPGQSIRYVSSQYLGGLQRRTYDATNTKINVEYPQLTVLNGGPALSPQFYTPLQLNAVDPSRMIISGYNGIYESDDQGETISMIKAISANDDGLETICYGAQSNPDLLYVGSGSQVYVRKSPRPDTLVASPTYPGGYVRGIKMDPNNPDTAFVVADQGLWSANRGVYQTTDTGATWTTITGNLLTFNPGTLRSIAFVPNTASGSIAVGTDVGVYIADGPSFNTWSRLGEDLPTAPVQRLDYIEQDHLLLAGTLGRGAWTLGLATRTPVDVMLVLDCSGSMLDAACPGCSAKLDVLKEAVEIFIQLWTALAIPDDRLGVTYFSTNIRDFNIGGTRLFPVITNAPAMIADINSQTTAPDSLTAMGGGLQSALSTLTDATRPRNIVLFTDGMQNVNPMVTDPNLDIANQPGCPQSNIDPTTPATRLNTDLHVKINTIGVGATPRFVNLLSNIATATAGLTKLTTAPDEDLRRFYVEELIDVLRQASPQLLAYRHGTLDSIGATESFTVNNGVKKVIFKLSWKRSDKMSFSVLKGGVDLTGSGKLINGSFYRILSIDMPTEINGNYISAGGKWDMKITGRSGADYESAAIVEEPQLEYNFSVGQKEYIVGDSLNLRVQLKYDNAPITDATTVTATIMKPVLSLGTLLSVNPMPAVPYDFRAESLATVAQKKLAILSRDPEFFRKLRPTGEKLTLRNNDDGSYSAVFSDTKMAGTYSIIFEVAGKNNSIGDYQRTEILSADVRFGKAESDKSDLYVSLFDKTADGRKMLLHIRPKDQFDNFLGPDYGDHIHVSLSLGSVNPNMSDLLDGDYTIPLNVPLTSDPKIRVTVMNDTVYDGPLSKLERAQLSVSVHAGITSPVSTFANIYHQGALVEVDFQDRFWSHWAIELVFGRYGFDPGFQIVGGTAYFKGYVPFGGWEAYAAVGAGVYKPRGIDATLGLSAGVGIDKPILPWLTGDIGAYYFHIYPKNDKITFVGVEAGLRFMF